MATSQPGDPTPPPNLALALLQAADWFDEALRVRLADAGHPTFTRGHGLVMAHLDPDGTSPSELARRIGITRQSAQPVIGQLVDLGVLERHDDPDDRRRHLMRLTPTGEALATEARRAIDEIERELAERIGRAHLDALRSALTLDWGPVSEA